MFARHAAVRADQAERQRFASRSRDRPHEHAKRLATANDGIERLVDRICAGKGTAAPNARLRELDGAGGERARLEAKFAALECIPASPMPISR